MGRPRIHTKASILARLQASAKELGRTPTYSELGSLVCAIRRHFGNYNTAVLAAGLTPRTRGGPNNRRKPLVFHAPSRVATDRIADVRSYWLSTDKSLRSA